MEKNNLNNQKRKMESLEEIQEEYPKKTVKHEKISVYGPRYLS